MAKLVVKEMFQSYHYQMAFVALWDSQLVKIEEAGGKRRICSLYFLHCLVYAETLVDYGVYRVPLYPRSHIKNRFTFAPPPHPTLPPPPPLPKYTLYDCDLYCLLSKTIHCKKELAVFPSPAGMSLIKLFLGGNNLVFSRPERVWSVTSRLGTGKWLTLFYSVWALVDQLIAWMKEHRAVLGPLKYLTAWAYYLLFTLSTPLIHKNGRVHCKKG
jgi:hypothetical protein